MTMTTGVADPTGIAAAMDGERLWERHMRMAEIGAIPDSGVNRQALSAEDIAARHLLISWAGERGFTVSVDDIGNLFVRRSGLDAAAAPVLSGSHMDSQPRGGRFDGIYGVLAGLAALEALDDAGIATRRPIEVAAWTNEEGSRFDPGCMGSMAFAGVSRIEDFADIQDAAGVYFGNALAAMLAATPEAGRRAIGFPVAAYVEAHIEQGPVLEHADAAIGVVTGIQGADRYVVDLFGETAHAGTTPLAARKDAFQAAVRAVAALNTAMADPSDVLRFTIGRFDVTPNSPNTVASHVRFSIDLRHPEAEILAARGRIVEEACRTAAAPCAVRVTQTFRQPPSVFDPGVIDAVDDAARGLGLSRMRLPSGAIHDSGFMCGACPTGMIFVPCFKGISHHEAEYASPEDCAAGARVLAVTLADLADRPG